MGLQQPRGGAGLVEPAADPADRPSVSDPGPRFLVGPFFSEKKDFSAHLQVYVFDLATLKPLGNKNNNV